MTFPQFGHGLKLQFLIPVISYAKSSSVREGIFYYLHYGMLSLNEAVTTAIEGK
jgi:hypothetical protein